MILDIMMPHMDGFAVLEQLKKSKEHKDLPVIIVTAKNLTNKEKSYLRDRAGFVIEKSGTHIEKIMEILSNKIKENASNDQNINN